METSNALVGIPYFWHIHPLVGIPVWTMKVVLFFSFLSILNHFWPFFGLCPKNKKMVKILPKWPQTKKIRPLLYFKLQKFHKVQWSPFSDLRPFWVIFCHFFIFHNFYKAPPQSNSYWLRGPTKCCQNNFKFFVGSFLTKPHTQKKYSQFQEHWGVWITLP